MATEGSVEEGSDEAILADVKAFHEFVAQDIGEDGRLAYVGKYFPIRGVEALRADGWEVIRIGDDDDGG